MEICLFRHLDTQIIESHGCVIIATAHKQTNAHMHTLQ